MEGYCGRCISILLLQAGKPNIGLQPTASSLRLCHAPTAGGADAARRQAAGAASCRAFPHRHQRRSGWRVTGPTDQDIVNRAPALRTLAARTAPSHWGRLNVLDVWRRYVRRCRLL